ALVYDGSIEGLADAMRQLASDESMVDRLSGASVPEIGDALEAYRSDPEPHHPRAQAGLATAASQRLEKFWQAKKAKPSLLQQAYRRLPVSWVDLLRRLPGPIKNLAKKKAS